jgi:hypothetical protein
MNLFLVEMETRKERGWKWETETDKKHVLDVSLKEKAKSIMKWQWVNFFISLREDKRIREENVKYFSETLHMDHVKRKRVQNTNTHICIRWERVFLFILSSDESTFNVNRTQSFDSRVLKNEQPRKGDTNLTFQFKASHRMTKKQTD